MATHREILYAVAGAGQFTGTPRFWNYAFYLADVVRMSPNIGEQLTSQSSS